VTSEQQRVYKFLCQRLTSGFYKCGAHLKVEPIAQELGLSRTPVRAALRRLVEEGLATIKLGHAVHALPWTEVDIEEKLQLRMLLEPYSSSLAASKEDPELIATLKASNQAMHESIALGLKGIDKIQEYQTVFPRVISNATNSPILRESLEKLVDMPVALQIYRFYSRYELKNCLHDREKIACALQSHNPEISSRLMKLHLQKTYLLFKKYRDLLISDASFRPIKFVQWKRSPSKH
jgi:DNA-binding GntR family transcriptional regulator